jgi:hypothetical protein
MTQKYTLAIGADMLLATVVEGADIDAAVLREATLGRFQDAIPHYQCFHNCVLLDEPNDLAHLIWESGNGGWIFDETDQTHRYAYRFL